jgi:hypothetical protein
MPFDLATRSAPCKRTRNTFLPRRGSLVLDGAEGTVISVDSGYLWLTLERDPRDIVLGDGMCFEIDRGGRTVIVAEEDSRIRVTRGPTVLEKIAARLVQATSRALRDWSCRLSRRAAPYF